MSEQLKESPKLLFELMAEISKSSKGDKRFVSKESSTSVDELRKKLHEKGLEVDGSKLISRLQESNKRQRTE